MLIFTVAHAFCSDTTLLCNFIHQLDDYDNKIIWIDSCPDPVVEVYWFMLILVVMSNDDKIGGFGQPKQCTTCI